MVLDVAILSPEKTILTYRLAGLGVRIWAHVVDLIVIVATSILFFLLIALAAKFVPSLKGLSVGIGMTAMALAPFLYFILLEGLWNGQTIGKKLTGIRVRMVDGTPVTFVAALGRNLLRPADMVPGVYLVGLLAMFTNPRSQRVGDLAANTLVVYERRNPGIYATAPHTAGIHPLEASVGDLPGMTLEEYAALRRFCDRFPELTSSVQTKLMDEIWQPIADRRRVPSLPSVHPIYLMEAVVMKYGRRKGLL